MDGWLGGWVGVNIEYTAKLSHAANAAGAWAELGKNEKWSTRHETNSVWYESFEIWATLQTKIQAEKGPPHPKIEKNKCVLKWLLGKIQCFKTMFFFFLTGKSPVADPPTLSGIFHYFF